MPHKLAGIDVHKKVESRTGASRRERTSAAGIEKVRGRFWYVTIHVTTAQREPMSGLQVIDSMVGPEGFEPPTKGL